MGLVAGAVLTLLIGVDRFDLPLLASDETVARLAVGAGFVAAVTEPVGALVFVGDGIFLGLLALGTMVVSTGAGTLAAVGLRPLCGNFTLQSNGQKIFVVTVGLGYWDCSGALESAVGSPVKPDVEEVEDLRHQFGCWTVEA